MALIKIFGDGTFETATAAAVGANHTKPAKPTYATAIKAAKDMIKRLGRDIITTGKIDTLKAARDKERAARDKLKAMKIPSVHKGKDLANFAKKINKLTDAINTLLTKTSAGRYQKISVLKKQVTSAQGKLKRFEILQERQKAKPAAPKDPKPKVTLPKLDGTPRTPRAPKDHGAAFNTGAKKIAGTVTRGIRSELRDHGKTALVTIRNSAGATAPKAVPSSKKADTATTHATKPARGAIGNTLTEIKKIKASIATGTLKGAKLVRAREELEKQREALRGLRAGKTSANQRAIVKPGTAKHMGGAKKIVGKESGMGDAATKPKGAVLNHTVATLTEKLKRLRVKQKQTLNKGQKVSLTRLINETKARLVAMKAKAK